MRQPAGRGSANVRNGRSKNLPKGLRALGLLKSFAASKPPLIFQRPIFKRHVVPKIYGRIGNLEVRLARTRAEVKMAQRLRYQVFFEEMSAVPSRLAQFRRRDEDAFDACCDHAACL